MTQTVLDLDPVARPSVLTLRDYQRDAVNATWAYWRERLGSNPVIVAPTGAGKSLIIAEVIRRFRERSGYGVMVCGHRAELLRQNREKIFSMIPDVWESEVGLWSASLGEKRFGDRFTVAQIQSLANVPADGLPTVHLMVVDEAHLIPPSSGSQYRTVIDRLRSRTPNMKVLGLTATPYRMDGGKIYVGDDAMFDGVSYDISVQRLIEAGHLVAPVTYGVDDVEDLGLDAVDRRSGEFVLEQQDEMIIGGIKRVCANIVNTMVDTDGRFRYRSALVFCPGVEAVHAVTERLRRFGTSVGSITGETPSTERAAVIDHFRSGRISVLVNCDVLTTGFDAPCVDLIVLLRATASTSLYVQMVGRGMRPHPGKDHLRVLDMGGNVLRHGPIDDPVIHVKGKADETPPLKKCKACAAIVPIRATVCPECETVFPKQERKAQTQDASRGPMLKSQAPEWERVLDVRYDIHRKDGRPPSIVAEYSTPTRTVRAWFFPFHGGWPTSEWEKHRRRMDVPRRTSPSEYMADFEDWPVPISIRVVRRGKYWNVDEWVYPLEDGESIETGFVT